MGDVDSYGLLGYDTTQVDIESDELLQPYEMQSIKLTNAQAEAVILWIGKDDDVIPDLDITADIINLEESNPMNIYILINGVNEIVLNKRLVFSRTIKFSYLGTGSGNLGFSMSGRWLEGAPYDMSKEIEQTAQVNRDQVGGASAGNEYFRVKSTAPKQVGVNPYNPEDA